MDNKNLARNTLANNDKSRVDISATANNKECYQPFFIIPRDVYEYCEPTTYHQQLPLKYIDNNL